MAKPTIPNIEAIIAMGLDPKTGLPTKLMSAKSTSIRGPILTQLRVKDEQEYVNRFIVHTPGLNMSSQEFFRMLYYHPDLSLMMLEGKPYLMPYTMIGGIDFYNRPNNIVPVPLTQGSDDSPKSEKNALREVLAGYKKKVIYDVVLPEDINDDIIENAAVLIKDYTPQQSNMIIPRFKIDEALLGLEADLFQYMRTSLLTGSGAKGIKVNDPDAAASVSALSNALDAAVLDGKPFIPLLSRQEIQELGGAGVLHAQDYMLAIQGIDNYRKQCLGIENSPMFDKKAYVNEAQTMSGITTSSTLADSLQQLQNSFDIWNSIYGFDWYVEINPLMMMTNSSNEVNDDGNNDGGNSNVDSERDEREDL